MTLALNSTIEIGAFTITMSTRSGESRLLLGDVYSRATGKKLNAVAGGLEGGKSIKVTRGGRTETLFL